MFYVNLFIQVNKVNLQKRRRYLIITACSIQFLDISRRASINGNALEAEEIWQAIKMSRQVIRM